jgi:hypothetical protein
MEASSVPLSPKEERPREVTRDWDPQETPDQRQRLGPVQLKRRLEWSDETADLNRRREERSSELERERKERKRNRMCVRRRTICGGRSIRAGRKQR